eukprot:100937_1
MGITVFSTIINPTQTANTFKDIFHALITSFVFVSTGGNYVEVVNPLYGDSSVLVYMNVSVIVVVGVIGLFIFVPVMIHSFQSAFKKSHNQIIDEALRTKTNNIIAGFIMLDMRHDGEMSLDEWELVASSSIISSNVLFGTNANASNDKENTISFFEFTSILTMNRSSIFVPTTKIKNITGRVQAFLEVNWYRRCNHRHYLLVYILIPSVFLALFRLEGYMTLIHWLMHISYMLNFIDINMKWCAYGRKRYFNLMLYETPALVEQALLKFPGYGDSTAQLDTTLSYAQRKWCNRYLGAIEPLSDWNKKTLTVTHQFEMYSIWFGTFGLVLTVLYPSSIGGYYYLFLQSYLLRLFTFIKYQKNQTFVRLIFRIFSKLINLIAFLLIFILIWARIGCTIFSDKSEYVLDSIYLTSGTANAKNFNTLGSSILTLLQLMVGEGFHEVMYLNVIATGIGAALYFIIYIVVVILIIFNVLIGLFLSEIEFDTKDYEQYEVEITNQRNSLKKSKLLIENQKRKLKEQEMVIKSLQETDKMRMKRILAKIKQVMSKRAEFAITFRNSVQTLNFKPLHEFESFEVSNVIKSWILNDIKHIEKSETILKVILEQSLSGEKMISLNEHLEVVLEKAISQYMTSLSFDKSIENLKMQIEQDQDSF